MAQNREPRQQSQGFPYSGHDDQQNMLLNDLPESGDQQMIINDLDYFSNQDNSAPENSIPGQSYIINDLSDYDDSGDTSQMINDLNDLASGQGIINDMVDDDGVNRANMNRPYNQSQASQRPQISTTPQQRPNYSTEREQQSPVGGNSQRPSASNVGSQNAPTVVRTNPAVVNQSTGAQPGANRPRLPQPGIAAQPSANNQNPANQRQQAQPRTQQVTIDKNPNESQGMPTQSRQPNTGMPQGHIPLRDALRSPQRENTNPQGHVPQQKREPNSHATESPTQQTRLDMPHRNSTGQQHRVPPNAQTTQEMDRPRSDPRQTNPRNTPLAQSQSLPQPRTQQQQQQPIARKNPQEAQTDSSSRSIPNTGPRVAPRTTMPSPVNSRNSGGLTTVGQRSPSQRTSEVDLWWGEYSGWAMLPTFLLCLTLTAVLAICNKWLVPTDLQITAAIGITAAIWSVQLIRWIYRVLGYRYRLTTRRFYQQLGWLYSDMKTVELGDMEKASAKTSLVSLLLGVGQVEFQPKDKSQPRIIIDGVLGPAQLATKIQGAIQQLPSK